MPPSITTSIRTISDKYRSSYADDIDALQAALDDSLSGTSDTVENYQRSLAAYFGARHALGLSSGAAAISVALDAAGVKAGDEVLVTPTCPLCTVYPIMAVGAKPVFVDTNIDNFGANMSDLQKVLSPKSRAVIDIPMWGYPTPVDQLKEFTGRAGLPLILDLAHAHGTKLQGRHLSTYADLACFSTHERKPLATGEGGFLLTDNAMLAEQCRTYSRFGNLNGIDFGVNYKLGALQAGLGNSRLKHLDAQLKHRQQNAHNLLARITNSAVKEADVITGGEPNYYFLILQLKFTDNRKFIDYLAQNGIPSDIVRYGCRCLFEFPLLTQFARPCPNGAALLASMTTIPVHPDLVADDMDYIANCINNYRP